MITTTPTKRWHPGVPASSSVDFCTAEDTDGRVSVHIQMSSQSRCVQSGNRSTGWELLEAWYLKTRPLHTTQAPEGFYTFFPVYSFITVILRRDEVRANIPALLCRSRSIFSCLTNSRTESILAVTGMRVNAGLATNNISFILAPFLFLFFLRLIMAKRSCVSRLG